MGRPGDLDLSQRGAPRISNASSIGYTLPTPTAREVPKFDLSQGGRTAVQAFSTPAPEVDNLDSPSPVRVLSNPGEQEEEQRRLSNASAASRRSERSSSARAAVPLVDAPVQFISINEEGHCHIRREASDIIKQLKGRIAVIGVAGLYRTGKSFLLNRLVGQQSGFEIGSSVNACTKGLWIWGRPMELAPDYHCIFMDTEGLGSSQRSATCDLQILSLAVLLSSLFVYNSMGAIDETALDDLHLVLQLAKRLHVTSKYAPTFGEASRDSSYLPAFFWVLRDFHLELKDRQGRDITEAQYLEAALELMPGQDEKNDLRKSIRDLFRQRDCITLPRPVINEADLRRLHEVPYNDLRPQFRAKVEQFRQVALRSVKEKAVDGKELNGSMFVDLAQSYCKAINSGGIPTIQSAWMSVMKHQLRKACQEAVEVYRQQMHDMVLLRLPLDLMELEEVAKACKANAVEVFFKTKLDRSSQAYQEYFNEFEGKADEILRQAVDENRIAAEQQCVCVLS